jgi:hypothetical protein
VVGNTGADDAAAHDDDVKMVGHDSVVAGGVNGEKRMGEILRGTPDGRHL